VLPLIDQISSILVQACASMSRTGSTRRIAADDTEVAELITMLVRSDSGGGVGHRDLASSIETTIEDWSADLAITSEGTRPRDDLLPFMCGRLLVTSSRPVDLGTSL